MRRFATTTALLAATWSTLAMLTPMASSSAALNTATSTIPIDPVTTLQMQTTANCVLAENQCYFNTVANLIGPDGPLPLPGDFYGRQSTTLRSMDRDMYLDSDFNGQNTRMFKSITDNEFATVFFGPGPAVLNGNTRTVDWATGRPKTDADYIVCAHIQVVYSGVNLTSPDACAQTTY
ncbi:hypothetical protein [Mycolicibacterium sediminis]|uniref:Secreted protein n=1 Tax=Mycolicibacterium sediminis TaxID=1286180 RepID=A0A7I7QIK3_9MYCO|nr:hypothetical protein [Mycolicibacterium sediminis]BBY26159.1 hypothetical protein MSEDJ_02550 [Mycolicibacterium sediminis]